MLFPSLQSVSRLKHVSAGYDFAVNVSYPAADAA